MDSEPLLMGYVKVELGGPPNDSAGDGDEGVITTNAGDVNMTPGFLIMGTGAGGDAHENPNPVFADPKIEVEDVKVLGSPVVGETSMASMRRDQEIGNVNDDIVNGNATAEHAVTSSNSVNGIGNDVEVKVENNEDDEHISSSADFMLPDPLEQDPEVVTPPGADSSNHEEGVADPTIEVVQVNVAEEDQEDLHSDSVMDTEAVDVSDNVDLDPNIGGVSVASNVFSEPVATAEKSGLKGKKRNALEVNVEDHVMSQSHIDEVMDSVARGLNSQSSQSQEQLSPHAVNSTLFVPPNWESHLNEVQGTSGPYKTFTVDATTPEHASITKLVSPLRVVSISQVVNPELWRQYTTHRNDMILRKSNDASLVFRHRRMSDDDDRDIQHSPNSPQYLEDRALPQYSPNDTLLFHCTAGANKLDTILRTGLDHMTSYGSRLGEGVYFSDCPEFVVGYDGTTTFDDNERIQYGYGTGTLLIFSVLLGDCLSLPELPGEGTDCLEYEPEKVQVQFRNSVDTSFDSITTIGSWMRLPPGGRGEDSKYVIFHKSQCCPLYMVKYNMPRDGTSRGVFEPWRGKTPPLAWTSLPGSGVPPMPSHNVDGGWPFLSKNVFGEMGITATSTQHHQNIDACIANRGPTPATPNQFDIIDEIIGSVAPLIANNDSVRSKSSNKRKLAAQAQPNCRPKRGNMDTEGQRDNPVASTSFAAGIVKIQPCDVNLERLNASPNDVPKEPPKSSPPPPPPVTLPTLAPPPFTHLPLQPPNWEHHLRRAMWSSSTFQTYPVDVGTQEYQAIKELVRPFQVVSVEQIVNPELWQQYKNKYKELLLRNSDNPIMLELLGMTRQDIAERSQNRQENSPDPHLLTDSAKYSPNEAILFHCSSDDNIHKIFSEGLDGKTSYDSKFRDRIYFSDDPRICIKWDRTVCDGDPTGTGTLLIFSVILGDCLSVNDLQHKSISRRGYVPMKKAVQKRHPNNDTFDSITGVRKYFMGPKFAKTLSNQYVIFDKTQCCPLYIVRYRSTRRPRGDCAETYFCARVEKPAISWKPSPGATLPMPNQNFDGRWPMHAKSFYARMGVMSIDGEELPMREVEVLSSSSSGRNASTSNASLDPASMKEKLEALVGLGFPNELANREALQRFSYNVEEAANYLLDQPNRPRPSTSRSSRASSSGNEVELRPSPPQLPGQSSPTLNMRRQLPHLVRATALTSPNWMENMRLAIKAMTSTSFSNFPVDPTSQEYKTIAQLLHPLPVTSVEQVINPILWQQYENRRKEMLLEKSDDADLLVHLGMDKEGALELVRLAQQHVQNNRVLQMSEQYSPNEAFLLHATKDEETLDKILRHGLDETTTYWSDQGKKIHFGDDPVFISHFDGTFKMGPGQGQEPNSDTGTILIFTVLLGDCLSLNNPSHQGQDDLGFAPKKLPVQMRNFSDDLSFDSVTTKTASVQARGMGNSKNSWNSRNAYIIFNKTQCCPLYMVKYKRDQFLQGDIGIGFDYVTSREELPTVAWRNLPVVKTSMPCQSLDGSWPFYAETVYKKMKGVVQSNPVHEPTPSTSNESEPCGSTSTSKEIQTACENVNLVTTRAIPLQPPNWLVNLGRTTSSLAKCGTYPVIRSTKEYQTIAELVSPLRILYIDQTVNPALWKRYMGRRKEMLELKSEDSHLLDELGLKLNEHRRYDLTLDPHLISSSATYSPNEVLLLHPIQTDESLKQILAHGLDETTTYGQSLGNGIYFTDDPLLSVGKEVGTIGTIIVCAVMLGDCLALAKFPGSSTASDSEYVPKKVSVQKRHSDDITFDSITFPKSESCGVVRPGPKSKKKFPNLKTSNEYVIFDKAQCCPLYMIKYERGQRKGMEPNKDSLDVFQTARRQPPTMAWRMLPRARSMSILLNVPMPNQKLDKSWPFYADALFQRMGVVPDANVKVNTNTSGDGDVKSDIEQKLHDHGFTNPTHNRIALFFNNRNFEATLRFLKDRANMTEDEWFAERFHLAYKSCRINLLPLPWSNNK